jgi:ABC-2 type transport system permease protein
MRTLLYYLNISLKTFFRDRGQMVWTFIFPILMLLLMMAIFGGFVPEGVDVSLVFTKNVMVIVVSASCFFNMGLHTASLREKLVLLHYHTTPVAPWIVLSGILLRQVVVSMINMIFVFLFTLVVYRPDLSGVHFFTFILMLILASVTFSSLGMIIAAVARTTLQANWMANATFMPFMFLSGSTLPIELFPSWLKTIAYLLPSTHLQLALTDILLYEATFMESIKTMGIFIAVSLVACLIGFKLFKWR